ncbi:MAG: hypothetical protein PHV11_07615 [Candidatus Bipolaricaulis sp.]|nr:hypothetical protein [Candidatus Bipolaricaulis sp.]
MANDKIEVGGVPKSSNEYETWISQGRTFDSSTGKWYEKATTPTTTPTNNTSYLSNLLNVAGDRGLDVSQILTNPNYVPPATPVEKYDYSAATSSANVLAEQLKSIQAQKDEAAKKLSEAGKESATDMASLISSYKPQTIDIAGATETAETKYGTDDLLAKLQTQNVKVASLQGELQKLETEELTSIDTAEGRMASRGAIEGEKDTITRAYNIKKAYKSAELYAEAAVAQAYSSNYTEAQKLVTRAVDAYTTEIKQEIENYNNLFSLQSDWIQTLNKKEQELLQAKYNELVSQEEQLRKDKTDILNLMLQYPNAGIDINDTMEGAVKKAQPYEAANQAAKVAGTTDTTDINSLLNGVYDYLELNPTKSVLDAVSTLPTAIRSDVISAYYLNQAFQRGEAEKPRNEVLSKIQSGNIDASVIQAGYEAGMTLEDMKAAAPNDEIRNRITDIQREISTQGRERALYGAGQAVSGVASGVGQWFTQPHESIAEQLSNQFSQFVSPFLRGISGK